MVLKIHLSIALDNRPFYFFAVIEAAVSEWEETATKQGTEENIYTDVKSEPLDGEETFEVSYAVTESRSLLRLVGSKRLHKFKLSCLKFIKSTGTYLYV